MALRPTYDKVLIKPDVQKPIYEQDTSHQIILPDRYKYGPWDPAHVGTVVAKGPNVELPIKRGDRVYYSKWGYAKLSYRGQDYVVMHKRDVLVIANGT